MVSVAVIAASFALTFSAYRSGHAAPVHLVVPPVQAEAFPAADARTLRVCADPNNLPFSNDRGEGFENEIAEIVARDLNQSVAYYWRPQRRGFMRQTLLSGACDVIMGVPSSIDLARVTHPYYRSSYVFVQRAHRQAALRSLEDSRLRTFRIAIPVTGDDYDNPPPAQALAVRHIVDNVHGYPVYGDYSKPHPSSGAVDAVRRGDADVAIAWGPIAGFAARHSDEPLELTPVPDDASVQFSFDIAMAVRKEDRALAAALDGALVRHAEDVQRILRAYGVPLTEQTARSGAPVEIGRR